MIKYSSFLKNQIEINEEYADKVYSLMYILENQDMLNESTFSDEELTEGVNDWLNKIGLKLHKGDGLASYIKQFTTGSGKLIIAAIKGDKDKVKDIASGLTADKVLDFILKLDMDNRLGLNS